MTNTTLEKWEEKTLHEVLNKVKYTSKIQSKLYKDKGKYPIISQEDVFISGYWDNPSDVYHVKHPIVIFGDHTKVVKYIDFDFVLGADGVKILDPTKDINAKFLYYWTKYVPLRNLGYARHYKLLSEKTMHFPPLPEQERIVAKLDKAFEAIDKVKANAEQNINNAKELFNDTLDSKIRTLYKNSSTQKLSEVCDVRDGTHDSPKYLDKRGHPFVTSKNLKNDKIDMEKITYISDSDFEKINERSKVDIGDVLFAMIGTIGNPVVITEEPDFAIKNVALFKNINKLEPQYLKFLLKSPSVLLKMQLEANGTTQKFVSLKYLRNFMVPVPSLSEQQKIVEKLDVLQEQTKQLEAIYTQKIKECNELKQSILQKAFRGEL